MISFCTQEIRFGIAQDSTCPFYECQMTACGASLSFMKTDKTRQQSFCLDTERYDDCPMFLGKVLRAG